MESEPNEKEKLALKKYKLKEEDIEKLSKENILFISIETLVSKEPKISEIFKKFQNKLVESDLNLFLHPKNYNYQTEGYKDLFKYEYSFPLKEKKQYAFIYDCLNFICYEKKDYSIAKKKEYYYKTLKDIFSMLNEKGIFIVLIDQYHFDYFFPSLMMALGDNYKTKLFINFYFIDSINFLFITTIQKMGKSDKPIILKDIKILITDYFSNLSSKIYGSTTMGKFYEYLKTPVEEMQRYNLQNQLNCSRLDTLHPGEFFQMRLKSSPLNSEISYIVTCHDNSLNTDKTNKKCVSIVLGYEITQELIFAKNFSYDNMCQQINAGRIIILESGILNPTGIKELAIELNDIIQYMKPAGNNEQVQIRVWEDQNQKILIYEDDKYLVRDNEDKAFTLRQLFIINNKYMRNMVQSKIRIKFASKSKIKNQSKGVTYYPIETPDKFKNKGVVQCIDDLNIFGFYEKSLICMSYFMDLEKLPRNTIKIMDIGAGTGVLSFYFYKLFKGCCEIDNIERNKSIYDIGVKYFGLKNYDIHKNRVNWFFEDVENVLDKMVKFNDKDEKKMENKYENKIGFYDLIFNEINDISPKEDTTPPKSHFSDDFLKKVKKLMKPCGIFMVNVMSKNYKGLYEIYLQLEKHFPTSFVIPSENGLCLIFFCFKDNYDVEKYNKKFQKNKDIIEKNEIVEFAIVKPILTEVISRVKEMEDQKEKLKENSKKI